MCGFGALHNPDRSRTAFEAKTIQHESTLYVRHAIPIGTGSAISKVGHLELRQ